ASRQRLLLHRNKGNDLANLQHDVQSRVDLARNNGEVINQVVAGWLLKVDAFHIEVITSCCRGSVCVRYRVGREAKEKIDSVVELLKCCRNLGTIGDVLKCNDLQELSKEIIGQCKGLPLAIVALAKALRNKDQVVWVGALQQLKKSIVEGMPPVMSSIRLSYDYLQSKETKFCFLLCCLFPEDYEISMDELLIHAMGEEILRDADTLAEARSKLLIVVGELISSCLLLKGDGDSTVMMHKFVRDVAISITSEEESNEFTIKTGMGLLEWPKIKNMESCVRLSLMDNSISDFPDKLDCPRLLTLSVANNRRLGYLPDGFFNGMEALVTLNLSNTGICKFPQTLSNLKNLLSLDLKSCNCLVDISEIGSLRNLEILNLCNCAIRSLPEEMKLLTNLKFLNLSNNYVLETIPPNVISGLSRLEELNMFLSFSNWEIEGTEVRRNASVAELVPLTNLSVIHLEVEDVSLVYKDSLFHWKKLMKFIISVCGQQTWKNYSHNCLCVSIHEKVVAEWVSVLWDRTDELRLIDCKSLENVVPLLHLRFNNLKNLKVIECPKMEYVMHSEEFSIQAMFVGLETLKLGELPGLRAICNRPLPKGSLEKLKSLKVKDCDELMNVLPPGLLISAGNLETIEIRLCSKVEEVFNSEGLENEGHASTTTTSMLSMLRKIGLSDLPKLTMIWKGFIPLGSLRNLKEVNIWKCKSLRYPLFSMGTSIFSNLKSLKISECESLKCLLPMGIVRGLQQLEELFVTGCHQIEDVIEDCQEGGEEDITTVLPQLKTLRLVKLPSLSRFYQQSSIVFSFPSLELLDIRHCQQLKRLPLGPRSAPELKEFNAEPWGWSERIEWEDESTKARLESLWQSFLLVDQL
ncbi:hypothetical protein GIB67_010514, partial [Kingdonia uniflora]